MAFTINNLKDNPNVVIKEQLGGFSVIEYKEDLSSTSMLEAQANFFMSKSNMRNKQLMIELTNSEVMLSAGAMQYMIGNIEMTSGVKGVGGLMRNIISSAATGTSAIKPLYKGTGTIMLETTYKYLWLIDVDNDHIVIDDGMFLACESTLDIAVAARKNVSSALLGGEGLFNLSARGKGIIALEAPIPSEEAVVVELQNDVLKVDGNFALMWSNSLDFTVEKSGKTRMGSAVSGEGLVNVYRGTGMVWLAPLMNYKNSLFQAAPTS
ncbi:AIM24 family protein [Paenibacillus sp. FSL R5-0912]|uniref:AIM24 family protein n=1 Tax=Paenibacillus sp. FSL R5-0912 TaxID=1536771 RepID=UPI0004F5E74D|nr:AIM24 family protein [Paenibacillus sp. FSL R5-0912]AIQ44330.1 transcriptional regulator [Paenibacillus sp. FSL R5-0912]